MENAWKIYQAKNPDRYNRAYADEQRGLWAGCAIGALLGITIALIIMAASGSLSSLFTTQPDDVMLSKAQLAAKAAKSAPMVVDVLPSPPPPPPPQIIVVEQRVAAPVVAAPSVVEAKEDETLRIKPRRCPNGLARCGSECVNLATDKRYCGSCRTRCKEGEICRDGRCVNAS